MHARVRVIPNHLNGMEPEDAVRGFESKIKERESRVFGTTAHKILLLDFATDPGNATRFQGILGQSQDVPFEIEAHHSSEDVDRGWLQTKAATKCLVILCFDKVPSCSWLDSLFGEDGETVNTPPFMVLAPYSSSRDVRNILAHGIAELFSPNQLCRPPEILGRLSYLIECLPAKPDASLVQLKQRLGLEHFVGESSALMKALELLPTIARNQESVLIRGETGTGKELVARALHRLSSRHEEEFVALNCGAINPDLFENELFGNVKGAFTGADADRIGLVRRAEGGSIFLDEINSLNRRGQGALLRLLDEHHEYRRTGSTDLLHADVRVMAATNVDLKRLIENGTFREDLYYRLNINQINLPPLRERGDDISLLASEMLKKLSLELHRPAPRLSPAAKLSLKLWSWPGNLRELHSVMRGAVTLCENAVILPRHLALPAAVTPPTPVSFKGFKEFKTRLHEEMEQREKEFLMEVLQRHYGNVKAAARELGMDRRNFWRLLYRHQLQPCEPFCRHQSNGADEHHYQTPPPNHEYSPICR